MKGIKVTINCNTNEEIIKEIDFPEPTPEELEARAKEEAKWKLTTTDPYMARIVEDLIDLFVSNGIISLTDLPLAVQEKLNERKVLRAKLADKAGGGLEKITT